MEKEEEQVHGNLLRDYHEGEGTIIKPRSILSGYRRLKCHSRLAFESKAQSHWAHDVWTQKVLANPGVSGKLTKVGVKKPLIALVYS